MPIIDLICLANSRKHSGRCIAGLATNGSGWIRPVSSTLDGTLFSYHYRLNDGSDVQLMDIVRVELVQPRPEVHQPENWVIGQSKWRLIQRNISIQDYRDIFRR